MLEAVGTAAGEAATEAGWQVQTLFSVGESFGTGPAAWRPPGILDGIVALPGPPGTLQVFVTHELDSRRGYPYALANGTRLTGSRVTRFQLDLATRRITGAALAYGELRDRRGQVVTSAAQVNEQPGDRGGLRGLDALCSAAGYQAGTRGFVDDIVFVNEESTVDEHHAHGGSVWALDPASGVLWALPALGRGSWENVTALDAPPGQVALLLGDDYEFGQAPLYLWVGAKAEGGAFPDRNGLVTGQLHVWVADNGDRTPEQWHGTGTVRAGRFVPIAVRDEAAADTRGHDGEGYLDDSTLRARARELGAFIFSRPEDLHTNPADGSRAVLASTGFGLAFPKDDWGGLYVVEVEWPEPGTGDPPRGDLTLLYDSDDFGDRGIRNPDNLVWGGDGRIYVQEDRAARKGTFGGETGREASLWALDPAAPDRPVRIAQVNRRAVPAGATDPEADVLGKWESSGVLDISALAGAEPGETVLLVDVQAHGVSDGPIGGAEDLVEAGQLLLLTRRPGGQSP